MPDIFISFKNVGRKETEIKSATQTERVPVPVGIKTPMSFARNGSGMFEMNMDISNQIDDNLRNLILTNHGERLGFYDLGANLQPLTTEISSKNNFDEEAMLRINTAVTKWMPYVQLEGFQSTTDYQDNRSVGKIVLQILYSVPAVGINQKILEVTLFVI